MKKMIIPAFMLICMAAMSFAGPQEGGKATSVIPDPGIPADPAGNIIYTPAFRAAWTMLKEDIVRADIRLHEPVEMVKNLNSNPYRIADGPDCIALSGFVENGIIDEINSQLRSKFGIAESGLDKYARDKEAIVCYSRFRKTVFFEMPFETLNWKFGKSVETIPVACFGITTGNSEEKEKMRKQVRFFDYRNPDDFILSLKGKDPGMEIILAKTELTGTLGEMIGIIDSRIRQSYPEEISEMDELIIPKIDLSVFHTYNELIGKFLANRGFRDFFFAEAGQDVSFKLDESGASAEATGKIVIKKGPVPRIYLFDKPFLLILRKTGSTEPDLVLWLANTDFLVPSA